LSFFDPRSSVLLLDCSLNLLLAAYLWWRYRHQRLLRHFALAAAGMGFYTLFLAGLAGFPEQAQAVAWVRAATALPYFTLLAFFRFAMVFSRSEGRATRTIFRLGLVAAAGDSLCRLSGLAPVNLQRHAEQGWFPGPDAVYFLLYLPAMLMLIGGGLFLLWRRRRQATGLERSQLSYVFLAVALALAFSLFNLLPNLEVLSLLGPNAFSLVIGWAITRQQLMEIQLLLRRGAVTAALGLLLGFAAAVALLLARELWGPGPSAQWFGVLVSALLFALGFDPLRRLLNRTADRLLGQRSLDPSARLIEYSLLATEHPRFEAFLQAVSEALAADFGLQNAGLLLAAPDGRLLPQAQTPRGSLPEAVAVEAGSAVARRLVAEPLGLDVDALAWTRRYEREQPLTPADEDALARSFLLQASAQAAFALREEGRLSGCLIVGAPRDGRVFSAEETGFFAALAQVLAQAVGRQQLQGAVEQADRLSALGTLAASLTHEIRNPLSSISAFVQMLPKRHQDASFIERFGRVVGQEVEKLQRLAEEMLDFARPGKRGIRAVDLGALAERHRELVAYQFSRRRVRLRIEAQRGVWVGGSESELAQVLLNLLLNALDASPEAAEVALTVQAEDGQAVMRVADQGPGLSEAAKERLFEPFFTTKAQGTGLGLSLCRKIVESYGGSIRVDAAVGQGSVFAVQIPLLQPES
jgi:signal transduction histidine kinase